MDAARQSDENLNTAVVAETMKLPTNNSYGYHIIKRNQHTVTKYLSDGKTLAAINKKLLKKLEHVKNIMFEVELAKAQIEHKVPIIVEFFILEWAKLRKLEPNHTFFTKFSDVTSFSSWKWTQIRCILLLPRKNWRIVSDLKWEQNGKNFDQMTVSKVSLPMP